MNELDIITLNNHDYVVVKMLTWEDKRYVLLEEVDEEENLLNNRLIAKVVITDGDEALSKLRVDSLEYQNIAKLFFEVLN